MDVDSRRRVRLVEVGVARTPPNQSPELRLKSIADAIDDWIARHAPHVIAIERVFAQENMRSVIAVAQVMGGGHVGWRPPRSRGSFAHP